MALCWVGLASGERGQRGADMRVLTASSFTMVSIFLMGTSGSMLTTISPVGRERGAPLAMAR